LKRQLLALKSKNKFVRYWALLGLKSHEVNDFGAQLSTLLKDPYQPNTILAASLVYELNASEIAKNTLEKAIHSPYDHISNLALQQIMYQSNAVDFKKIIGVFEDQQKQLAKKDRLFNADRSASMFRYILAGGSIAED
jgi:hypothetical protein